MRIVLDTNVLVSGIFNPVGPPGRIIDLILDGRIQVLYDDRILAEYLDVLERPQLAIDPSLAQAIVGYIRLAGERIFAFPLPADTLLDSEDLPFAEVAAAGSADFLVTGITRHFTGLEALDITIQSPAQYLETLTNSDL
jgi:putative PIN family toxin of toxin-antitoxin system